MSHIQAFSDADANANADDDDDDDDAWWGPFNAFGSSKFSAKSFSNLNVMSPV